MLNNSSADKSASNDGTAYSSDVTRPSQSQKTIHYANNLIMYFSTIIQLKLPITGQDIDPAMSPELEDIKIETSRLPDQAFQTFVELFRLVDSYQSELAQYRIKAQKSEPIPDDMFEKKQQHLLCGGCEIINKHRHDISKHSKFVEATWKKLYTRIRQGFNEKETTEHQQGRLDAIKDDIVPQMSTFLAPVQTAVNVGVNLVVCDISQNLDQKLIGLGISDSALRGEAQIFLKTMSKLETYNRDRDQPDDAWVFACRLLCLVAIDSEGPSVEAITPLQKIDLASDQTLQFISPIKDYLRQWNEKYGSGITVIREVDNFCDVMPKIIEDIERIFEAKQIIKSSHQAEFGTTVYNLGLTIFNFLGLVRDNFKQKTIDPVKHRQFLQVITLQFTKTTVRLNDALCTILETHSSKRKGKKAEENRMADARCFEDGIWKNKTLVKPSEVRLILERVERAVDAISCLVNTSGTGKIMKSIRGDEIERADFKLDLSITSLRRLDRILGQDVDAGLERLEKLLIEQEPKAQAGQLKSFLRMFNRHKR